MSGALRKEDRKTGSTVLRHSASVGAERHFDAFANERNNFILLPHPSSHCDYIIRTFWMAPSQQYL